MAAGSYLAGGGRLPAAGEGIPVFTLIPCRAPGLLGGLYYLSAILILYCNDGK